MARAASAGRAEREAARGVDARRARPAHPATAREHP